jgi:hypothetical protein
MRAVPTPRQPTILTGRMHASVHVAGRSLRRIGRAEDTKRDLFGSALGVRGLPVGLTFWVENWAAQTQENQGFDDFASGHAFLPAKGAYLVIGLGQELNRAAAFLGNSFHTTWAAS